MKLPIVSSILGLVVSTYTAFNVAIPDVQAIVETGLELAERSGISPPPSEKWELVESPHVTTYFYAQGGPSEHEFQFLGSECEMEATHLFWMTIDGSSDGLLGISILVPDDSQSCPPLLTRHNGEERVLNPKKKMNPISVMDDQYAHITVSLKKGGRAKIAAVDTGVVIRELSKDLGFEVCPFFGFSPNHYPEEENFLSEPSSLPLMWKKTFASTVTMIPLPKGTTIKGHFAVN
eukprot:GDKJ01030314.1.p1 GENE.GDKJ01030314.1~~GDKJ01030314.1.p1  ORF type:complete len:234 (-),score=45.10 GDKJ01030314.1:69-770(-)